MRIMRASVYPESYGSDPLTTVVRADHLRLPLADAIENLKTPGVFIVFEVFELDGDPSVEEATFKALERMDTAREKDMAILYYWTAAQWRLLSPGGMVANPDPAPLSEEQVVEVFEQLKLRDDYVRQHLVTPVEGGNRVVIMRNGTITREDV